MPRATTDPSVGYRRKRRRLPLAANGIPSRFTNGQVVAAPAAVTIVPQPFGNLADAPASVVADIVAAGHHQVRQATTAILDFLSTYDGDGWQKRWDASPLGGGLPQARDALAIKSSQRPMLTTAVRGLFCARVIRPTLETFRQYVFRDYIAPFTAVQDDSLLTEFAGKVIADNDMRWEHRRKALADVCTLLTVQGITMQDLSPAALLHHAHEYRRVSAILAPGGASSTRFAGVGAWQLLHRFGFFTPDTPATMRGALMTGQLTVAELVDRHAIANSDVRDLLVEYLTRRSFSIDYASLNHLARNLTYHFWSKVEHLRPGQPNLHLDPDLYSQWRDLIRLRDDGKPRIQQDTIIMDVRSFYLDLHSWAVSEPDRWALWAAPCPVPPSEMRGAGKRRLRHHEKMADRTRQLQPLLPVLCAEVETRYFQVRALLDAARKTTPGGTFTFEGRPYQRVARAVDSKNSQHAQPPIRALDQQSGQIIDVESDEEEAFWHWAIVETLRQSGIRIEELCELTHLSVRQYQRPSGEVIALLVIAPSKTDRERVIPMSTEPFHVIASIVRRHTTSGRKIELITRFDPQERVWSQPLPHLFQRQSGSRRAVISTNTILGILSRLCQRLSQTHHGFADIRLTPHDFRRIFATDLVNSGLPIHIGAALLGHLNIQTTRGYVALFDDTIIGHYMAHLAQRRALRPAEEYRPATSAEWADFEEHFDRRKVELGNCARPYGTSCQHEHACVRCPMLHVSSTMIGRLEELEADLLARRARAESEQWLGEIEGIDLTLTFLRDKKAHAQRLAHRVPVTLGLPTPRKPAVQKQAAGTRSDHTESRLSGTARRGTPA